MSVAIVGAGVSGLVAAHLLHATHDITIFESDPRPGGHVNAISVETEAGTHAVDTGFIVFNDRSYPNFERLLDRLNVATQPSTMSFSVSDERGDFEYNGASPNGLFATRAHLVTPWLHRMLADRARFNREARALLRSGEDPPLRGWLAERGYSREFVERLIVPQAAAVWSADPEQMWSFPARFLAEFFDSHGMLGLRGRPVTAIHRHDDHVTVTARGHAPERFDEVVVAAHADQALAMLADASDREHELLGAFPTRRSCTRTRRCSRAAAARGRAGTTTC